jgi:O-antigen/teichoic acid export membrane protein
VAILYVATIIGLGFSFFGSVLNSRLLSKEHFGDWKYLQNYLLMISYFVNFGIYNSGGRLIASTDDPERIATLKGYMLYKTCGRADHYAGHYPDIRTVLAQNFE